MTSRVHTRLDFIWDGTGYVQVLEEGFWYDGPVALCKGDDTAKAAEQQQSAFNSQLMSLFTQQFGKQSQIESYLQGKLQPMIDNPTGYSPEALAAMRTGATDTLSNTYQNAQKALQGQQFASGSRELPSGVNDQVNASLMQSEASDKAAAQDNITLQNENLKQSNYWAAINALNGQEAQLNPLGYAGAATSGSGAVAGLSQAVTQSQQSGLMGVLGGMAGSALSGAGQAGGFGKLFSCHVAAAVFNEDFYTGEKTNLVRGWLYTEFAAHWYGKPILWLYAKTGRWVAKQRILVKIFTPVFNRALIKARESRA